MQQSQNSFRCVNICQSSKQYVWVVELMRPIQGRSLKRYHCCHGHQEKESFSYEIWLICIAVISSLSFSWDFRCSSSAKMNIELLLQRWISSEFCIARKQCSFVFFFFQNSNGMKELKYVAACRLCYFKLPKVSWFRWKGFCFTNHFSILSFKCHSEFMVLELNLFAHVYGCIFSRKNFNLKCIGIKREIRHENQLLIAFENAHLLCLKCLVLLCIFL